VIRHCNEGWVRPFLFVIDSVKAALMKTEVALPLLKDKSAVVRRDAAPT